MALGLGQDHRSCSIHRKQFPRFLDELRTDQLPLMLARVIIDIFARAFGPERITVDFCDVEVVNSSQQALGKCSYLQVPSEFFRFEA